jgi:glutathione synthase/RimK-type ligase-like ATP-grasp enzyme
MIYLATCSDHPTGVPEDQLLLDAFESLGLVAAIRPWDGGDWRLASGDVCVIRSTWNYVDKRDEFAVWRRAVASRGRLVNPLDVIEWNIDKKYLVELQSRGAPTVPTVLVAAGVARRLEEHFGAFGCEELVVKPTVGAGSSGLEIHSLEDLEPTASGVRSWPYDVLLQPLVPAIRTEGEWSLVFVAGAFQHAIRKRPARGDIRSQPEFGATVTAEAPPSYVLAAAEQTIVAGPETTFARIDLVDNGGTALLMEAEYIEPQLFLEGQPGTVRAFAEALAALHG